MNINNNRRLPLDRFYEPVNPINTNKLRRIGTIRRARAVNVQPKITAARAIPRFEELIWPLFICDIATCPRIAPTGDARNESTRAQIGSELSVVLF
jgi:hypothetical protein